MTLLLQDTLIISPETKEQVEKNTAAIAELQKQAATAYHFKGTKPTFADLPMTNNKVGDVWDVQDTGMNYGWTGTEWDELGPIIDLEPYITKDDAAATYLTKQDAETTYSTKTEVTSKISSIMLEGTTAPTSTTTGTLGQLYKDTLTGLIYRCSEIDNTIPSYTWEELGSGVTGNFYSSLSVEQKAVLLTDGTYNNKEVKDGTIFTTESGNFEQYSITSEESNIIRELKKLSYNKNEIDDLLNNTYVTASWTISLPVENWVENKQTLTVQGINADSSVDLGTVTPITREEMIKISNAGLFINELSENTVVIECINLPTEALTIKLKREMATNEILERIKKELIDINGV